MTAKRTRKTGKPANDNKSGNDTAAGPGHSRGDESMPTFRLNAWARLWLPYQFMEIKVGGKTAYLPVNRDYRPLGLGPGARISDVEQYAPQAVTFAQDPHGFDGIWSDPAKLYLYGDDAASRADYFLRLARLSAKTMKPAGKPAGGRR